MKIFFLSLMIILFLEKGILRNVGNYKNLHKNDELFKKMAGSF
jgi:hypothetical protein